MTTSSLYFFPRFMKHPARQLPSASAPAPQAPELEFADRGPPRPDEPPDRDVVAFGLTLAFRTRCCGM